ncbi:MAG: hypothetical protein AAFR66_03825 [Bacteroidota bacterium]
MFPLQLTIRLEKAGKDIFLSVRASSAEEDKDRRTFEFLSIVIVVS